MSNNKLRGKDLRKLNYTDDQIKSLALNIISKHFKYTTKQEKIDLLVDVKNYPENYTNHEFLAPIAERLIELESEFEEEIREEIALKPEPTPYKVYGKQFIEQSTILQMDMVMRLPIARKGALMPDAHVGYGMPIGGVLATENQVIPYGVGMDIGCRMSLTLYDTPARFLKREHYAIKTALKEHTYFGLGALRNGTVEHEVLDSEVFQETKLLRQLHGKAAMQLGTSGGGNHFVEFGIVTIGPKSGTGIPEGDYIGLLAHSGSRGLGATIAQYYTQVAIDTCHLPKGAQHLAWLELDTEVGQEYWRAMNLAGDYAKACHDVIHKKLAKLLSLRPILKIENHHNFAWKELQSDGKELIVHRKGATPAKEGVLGIIPGSMATPGYIVRGKGKKDALNSASHGAGRKLSRKKARESTTNGTLRKLLRQKQITLIGGTSEEAPMAYKDIEKIIETQKGDLVDVIGTFNPVLVRMAK